MEQVSPGRVRLPCAHCGKIFETYMSVAKRRPDPTCSLSCARSYKPSKKRQRVERSCIACGASFHVIPVRRDTAKYCSAECKNRTQRGALHHSFKDGRSQLRGQHRKVVAQIVRSKGKCEECGAAENLHGHHIKSYADFPELRSEPSNILVLCAPCHAAKHPRIANKLFAAAPKLGVTKTCPICGAGFYVKPSHVTDRHTCSAACGYRRRSLLATTRNAASS